MRGWGERRLRGLLFGQRLLPNALGELHRRRLRPPLLHQCQREAPAHRALQPEAGGLLCPHVTLGGRLLLRLPPSALGRLPPVAYRRSPLLQAPCRCLLFGAEAFSVGPNCSFALVASVVP